MAATARYFVTKEEYLYFHSYMADYFLGTYGGGVCKPFRYTEVIPHWKIGTKSQMCLKGQRAQNRNQMSNIFKGAKAHVPTEEQELNSGQRGAGPGWFQFQHCHCAGQ